MVSFCVNLALRDAYPPQAAANVVTALLAEYQLIRAANAHFVRLVPTTNAAAMTRFAAIALRVKLANCQPRTEGRVSVAKLDGFLL
jgi:hypothetical protein